MITAVEIDELYYAEPIARLPIKQQVCQVQKLPQF